MTPALELMRRSESCLPLNIGLFFSALLSSSQPWHSAISLLSLHDFYTFPTVTLTHTNSNCDQDAVV